jgi:hypothetical protein
VANRAPQSQDRNPEERPFQHIADAILGRLLKRDRGDGHPILSSRRTLDASRSIPKLTVIASSEIRRAKSDDRDSLPYFNWEEIRGLSIGGRAVPVTDPKEINRVSELMLRKFPQILQYALAGKKGVFLVRITPEVISVLDYRKGFGHTDLVKL